MAQSPQVPLSNRPPGQSHGEPCVRPRGPTHVATGSSPPRHPGAGCRFGWPQARRRSVAAGLSDAEWLVVRGWGKRQVSLAEWGRSTDIQSEALSAGGGGGPGLAPALDIPVGPSQGCVSDREGRQASRAVGVGGELIVKMGMLGRRVAMGRGEDRGCHRVLRPDISGLSSGEANLNREEP